MAKGDDDGTMGWKIFAAVYAIVAAVVARKAITLVWTKATGKEPPANPEDPEVTWAEAATWAAASGVAIGLARLFAQRQAARRWRASSGSLPPGLNEATP